MRGAVILNEKFMVREIGWGLEGGGMGWMTCDDNDNDDMR
jgi:hypothetical protein